MKTIDHFEIYKNRKTGDFYYRFRARNGLITSDGGQGFSRKSTVVAAIKRDAKKHYEASIKPFGIVFLEEKS